MLNTSNPVKQTPSYAVTGGSAKGYEGSVIRDKYGNWVLNNADYVQAVKSGNYQDPFPDADNFAKDHAKIRGESGVTKLPQGTFANQDNFDNHTLDRALSMYQQKLLNEGYVRRGDTVQNQLADENWLTKQNQGIDKYIQDTYEQRENGRLRAEQLRSLGLSSDPINISAIQSGLSSNPIYSQTQLGIMNSNPYADALNRKLGNDNATNQVQNSYVDNYVSSPIINNLIDRGASQPLMTNYSGNVPFTLEELQGLRSQISENDYINYMSRILGF